MPKNKMIRKISLKNKLILSYITVILFSFGFIAFFLARNLEKNTLRDLKTSLVNQGYLIQSQVSAQAFKKENLNYLDALAKDLSAKIKCRITLINSEGKVLADSGRPKEDTLSMENHADRTEIESALGGQIGIETHYSRTLKREMMYVALPFEVDNEIIGALRLALPLENIQGMLFTVRKSIFMGLLFALGLAFVLGSILAEGILRPIKRIIAVARGFARGDFSRKILAYPQDEIGELTITLNKMAQDLEEKIREITLQNQQLAAIFNSMVEGVIVLDNNSRIVSVNPTIEKIFGVDKNEVKGRNFLEVIRNDDISQLIRGALKSRDPLSRELALVWPVKGIFQIDASAVYVGESINGCLLVIHDITEIRKLETIRSEFVANVSHELKTPLTSIRGFVETLLEGAWKDKENSLNFLKIIQEHTRRLDSLINDLLDLSYLESKEAKLESEELKLKDLTDEVLSGFRAQLKKKGVKAENRLTDTLRVEADKNKIEQVLVNLIDNAIKFNKKKGFIKIYAEDSGDRIKITVEDSGSGIPPKDIPRIFERFYRVDKARSRELGGTGLGLSIVKHIMDLHGGMAGVESTESLGSKFWFTLPK